MSTTVSFFPFDLFGSRGAGAGAELLADAVREMLADNKREQLPTRARAYAGQVRLREFGFETPAAYHDWRRQGRRAVRDAWKRGDFLCWMAGNHLGVLPVYDELSGDDDTLVIQFDAHLDIYHLSDCTSELSHGNFLMHCAGPLPALVNLGHRELLLPPRRRLLPGDLPGVGPGGRSRAGAGVPAPRWRGGQPGVPRPRLRRVRSGLLPGSGSPGALRAESAPAVALARRRLVGARRGAGRLRVRSGAR